MTTMYRTSGEFTNPVTDVDAAQAYLHQHDMTEFVDGSLPVFDVRWDLTDEAHWQVQVITDRPLTDEESAALSEWISGQNSDGLGEGFEQQEFAEHGHRNRWGEWEMDEDDDGNVVVSSFD